MVAASIMTPADTYFQSATPTITSAIRFLRDAIHLRDLILRQWVFAGVRLTRHCDHGRLLDASIVLQHAAFEPVGQHGARFPRQPSGSHQLRHLEYGSNDLVAQKVLWISSDSTASRACKRYSLGQTLLGRNQ